MSLDEPTSRTADDRDLLAGGAAAEVGHDVLRLSGPDARSFLEGQLSQVAPPAGGALPALLLAPDGKLVAWMRWVAPQGDGGDHLLLADAGTGEAAAERLLRFRLRTKVEVDVDAGVAVRRRFLAGGPVAGGGSGPGVDEAGGRARWTWAGRTVEDAWGAGAREAGEDPAAAIAPAEAYDAARAVLGLPVVGVDVPVGAIPAEGGAELIASSVSFTKGCYTGQELVARVDSRGGNVPRRLLGVVIDGDDVPAPGAVLAGADREVGTITTAARSASLGAVAGLALVHRSAEPGAVATARWAGGEAVASIRALPLLP